MREIGRGRKDLDMGRPRRVDVGGMIYHVLNRANFPCRLFQKATHYRDFLDLVEEDLSFVPMRILALHAQQFFNSPLSLWVFRLG